MRGDRKVLRRLAILSSTCIFFISCYLLLSLVISCYLLLSLVISCYLLLSLVISYYLLLSLVISGYLLLFFTRVTILLYPLSQTVIPRVSLFSVSVLPSCHPAFSAGSGIKTIIKKTLFPLHKRTNRLFQKIKIRIKRQPLVLFQIQTGNIFNFILMIVISAVNFFIVFNMAR